MRWLVVACAGLCIFGGIGPDHLAAQVPSSGQPSTAYRDGGKGGSFPETTQLLFASGDENAVAAATPDNTGVEAEGSGSSRLFASVDYLVRWLKPVCLKPPTLTVGSPGDAFPGAVGQPNTRVVVGDHKFEFIGASGVRPKVGLWLTDDQSLAFEVQGFVLEQVASSQSFRGGSGGPPTYIPFQDPANANRALPFSVPGVVDGVSTGTGRSRLWGVEANLEAPFSVPRGDFTVGASFLLGFRYLDLRDQVIVANRLNLVIDPAAFALGEDNFTTRNHFYGPQIGSRLGLCRGNWSMDLLTKIALGETHQVSQIAGSPLLAASAISPALLPGPFFALPSNRGRLTSNRLTLAPEVEFKVHYLLMDSLSVSLGYGCLYWNRILCPGDQMDPHVNVTQLPFHGPFTGAAVPAASLVHTDAFAQGFDAGLEFRF